MADRRLPALVSGWFLGGAAFLAPFVSHATAVHRSPPDTSAIKVVESNTEPPDPYVSARSLMHFLRAALARDAGDSATAIEQLNLAAVYDSQHAYPQYMLAEEHFLLGHLAQAESAVRTALSIQADHEPSLLLLGRITFQRGRYDEALDAFQRASTADPFDAEPYTWLADAYLSHNDTEAALTLSERVDGLAATTRDPAASRRLQATAAATTTRVAEMAAAQGQLERAEQLYRQAVAEEPNRASHLITLARFYERQSRLREGADALMRAFSVVHDDPQLAIEAAGLYLRVGDRRAAVSCAEVLATYAVGKEAFLRRAAEAMVSIGEQLMREQAPEQAQRVFSLAVATVPDWSTPIFHQGEALERRGMLAEAAVAFRKIGGGDPLFVAAQARAALCEYRRGARSQALTMLRGLQKAYPDTPEVTVALATTMDADGHPKEAARLLEAFPLSQVTPAVARTLAEVGHRVGHDAQVLRVLDAAVAHYPADLELSFDLVQALDRAGRRDEAVAEARLLADRAPTMGAVLDFLARALTEQGGPSLDEAQEYARRAVLGWPDVGRYVRTLALVQEARGSGEALFTWRRAADMLPGDADTQLHLAEAESRAGHPDEARLAFSRAMTLGQGAHDKSIVERARRGINELRTVARSPAP